MTTPEQVPPPPWRNPGPPPGRGRDEALAAIWMVGTQAFFAVLSVALSMPFAAALCAFMCGFWSVYRYADLRWTLFPYLDGRQRGLFPPGY